MERSYFVVDAFTNERFSGNAAAVVLDTEELDDRRMRLIAAEFNLSETTFVFPAASVHEAVRFRWFTPAVEVEMCGHATIAGVHALIESGMIDRLRSADSAPLRIDTKSGIITAYVECIPGEPGARMIWLELVPPVLTPCRVYAAELAKTLNLPQDAFERRLPPVRTQDGDLLMFVRNVGTLNDARPDFSRLRDYQQRERLRGLCLATTETLTPAVHVQSRFFAPAVGVDEDPVTGSVHGPLAVYLVKHGLAPTADGMAAMCCLQGKAGGRAGMVFALAAADSANGVHVRIGGRAVTAMRGTLMA